MSAVPFRKSISIGYSPSSWIFIPLIFAQSTESRIWLRNMQPHLIQVMRWWILFVPSMVSGSLNWSLHIQQKWSCSLKMPLLEKHSSTFTLMTDPYDNQIETSICNRKHEREKSLPRNEIMMHLLEPIFKIRNSCSYFLIFLHHIRILRTFHTTASQLSYF